MSKWLSTADVAARYGCSTERVRQLVSEGKLNPERTMSGFRIFRSEDVERLAEERARIAEEKQAAKAA